MKKKMLSLVLVFVIVLSMSGLNVFAEDSNLSDKYFSEENNSLPNVFTEEVDEKNSTRGIDSWRYYTIYTYIKQSSNYGPWRNGVSGRGPATLTFNSSVSQSYNMNFTANVNGVFGDKTKVGAALGVTLGSTKSYNQGISYSISVPNNRSLMIIYRPYYFKYKVETKKMMERYNYALGGWERYERGTDIGYVDVFSSWNFNYKAI